MNKVLLAVGLLSTGLAVGQNQTTKTSSTTTSTSNYNTSNTNNENSRNATMGTNSSTDRPTSTTGSPYNRSNSSTGMGTSGTYSNSSTSGSYNSNSGYGSSTTTPSSSGSYNSNSMNNGSTTTPSTTGSYNSNSMNNGSTTTPSTNGSYNSNSMNSGSTTTPSTTGSYNTNSVGTGTSATTPSTTGDLNSTSNSGANVTTNSTYSTETTTTRPYRTKDYKNFAYGIYAGLNSTRFRGESIDTENPSGRIGYQAGFFVRGGGRLYGQIGAEYFASSSNYFRPGDGQSAAAIRDQINIQYIQIPVYVGFKLTESDRGISAIRVQVGAEYANRISSSSGQFNLSNSEIKSGSFNALGQLGFDIGPFLIDLTYHHGLSDAVQINTFQGSSRRILSASVGFKF